MAFEEYKNLWVFIETEEGKAKPVGYELLTPGRRLADANQEKLVAVVIGKNVEGAAKEAEEYGADEVILVDEDAYYNYNTDAFSDAMEQLIKKYKPSTVLIGATNNGRDMGPRLSCRLGTGLTADCTDLSVEEETGNIIWTRPAFGGNLMANILCPGTRPQMGTVRPGVFKKGQKDPEHHAEVIREPIVPDPGGGRSDCFRRTRTWKGRKLQADPGTGGCAWRCGRRFQSCSRRRLDSACTPGWTDRKDCCAEALHCLWYFWSNSASGRNVRFRYHHCHQ